MMDFIIDLAKFTLAYILVFVLNVVLFGGLIYSLVYFFGGQ